ncbi:putative odorant-binding protein A5 [Drosophila kikkawai]|uniref:Odorant-binding protein A5 n=1 Tax=Drosophila kikkawai TaxID=30033 RepID=A0A6P4I2J9_DROKI|nr:putative odorant-binding protein A5 [Drosophila kikkawai]
MLVTCPTVDPVIKLIEELKKHKILPRLLPCKPSVLINVLYPCDIEIQPGDQIVITEVVIEPIIRFIADPEKFHTLIMVDLDVSPDSEWLLWLVGNFRGCDVVLGQTIAAYDNMRHTEGANIHRVVFLAYQQILELDFDEPYMPAGQTAGRSGFNCNRFARKYALGNPRACNFFLNEWQIRWTPQLLDNILPKAT